MGNSKSNDLPIVSQSYNHNAWIVISSTAYCQIIKNLQNGQQAQQYTLPLSPKLNFFKELQIYEYRRTQNINLVSVINVHKQESDQVCIGMDIIKVRTQRIVYRLSDIHNLSYAEAFYILRDGLLGFNSINQKDGALEINQNMIGFTPQGRLKVWLNQNFQKNHAQEISQLRNISQQKQIMKNQSLMVLQILSLVQSKLQGGSYPNNFKRKIQSIGQFKRFRQTITIIVRYGEQQKIVFPDHIQLDNLHIIKTQVGQLYNFKKKYTYSKLPQQNQKLQYLKLDRQKINNQNKNNFRIIQPNLIKQNSNISNPQNFTVTSLPNQKKNSNQQKPQLQSLQMPQVPLYIQPYPTSPVNNRVNYSNQVANTKQIFIQQSQIDMIPTSVTEQSGTFLNIQYPQPPKYLPPLPPPPPKIINLNKKRSQEQLINKISPSKQIPQQNSRIVVVNSDRLNPKGRQIININNNQNINEREKLNKINSNFDNKAIIVTQQIPQDYRQIVGFDNQDKNSLSLQKKSSGRYSVNSLQYDRKQRINSNKFGYNIQLDGNRKYSVNVNGNRFGNEHDSLRYNLDNNIVGGYNLRRNDSSKDINKNVTLLNRNYNQFQSNNYNRTQNYPILNNTYTTKPIQTKTNINYNNNYPTPSNYIDHSNQKVSNQIYTNFNHQFNNHNQYNPRLPTDSYQPQNKNIVFSNQPYSIPYKPIPMNNKYTLENQQIYKSMPQTSSDYRQIVGQNIYSNGNKYF